MHYYVDGYNLIFRLLRAGDDLKLQREELVDNLFEKVHLLNLDLTIVFDSQYHLGEMTRSHKLNLQIVFTNEGETADDYILSELKTEYNPRQHTVITSDKRLAWRVRRLLGNTEPVEVFVKWLEKRYSNKKQQQREKKKSIEEQVEERIKTLQPDEPQPGITAEESYDYYLQQFEKELGEEVVKKIEKESQTEKQELIEVEEELGEGETDFERWERLFIKKVNEEGNGA